MVDHQKTLKSESSNTLKPSLASNHRESQRSGNSLNAQSQSLRFSARIN